jgi:hypothetical protein
MADDPTTPTSTTNHLFDNPDLDALQFLEAVMHSPEVDIVDRLAAAAALLPYYQPPIKPIKPTVRPWYNVTRKGKYIPGDIDTTIKIVIPELIPQP